VDEENSLDMAAVLRPVEIDQRSDFQQKIKSLLFKKNNSAKRDCFFISGFIT